MPEKFKVVDYDKLMAAEKLDKTAVRYMDADTDPLRISGFAFRSRGEAFRRLPDAPELPEAVRALSQHTAGGQLAFRTDSTFVKIRTRLSNNAKMDHMPFTGSQGFDLYVGNPMNRRFAGVTRFAVDSDGYEHVFKSGLEREMREYLIDFPLYSGVEKLELGVDTEAEVLPPTPWNDDRPVVYYGTSITQGGCASRPGQADSNILSRKWNIPVLNFGFSGSGRCEPEVVEHLARVKNPRMIIFDHVANTGYDRVLETMEPAIDIWRAAHPDVPVVLMEISIRSYEWFDSAAGREKNLKLRFGTEKFFNEVAERRRRAGDDRVFVVTSVAPGDENGAGLVDGIHLNDYGFLKKAEIIAPQLEEILNVNAI